MRKTIAIALVLGCAWLGIVTAAEEHALTPAGLWRSDHLIIDLHQHINCTTQCLARAVKIMDAAGVGLGVNLTAGTVTPGRADQTVT